MLRDAPRSSTTTFDHPARAPAFAGVATLAAVVLAGCMTSGYVSPPDLSVTASWQQWEDESVRHLILNVSNSGGSAATLGAHAHIPHIIGPAGEIYVYWEEDPVTVPAGGSALGVLHPYRLSNGGMGLAASHDHGPMREPVPGGYHICVDDACTSAEA